MNRKRILGAALLVVGAAGLLHATIVPALTLEELVERSELIVQGHCVRTWSAWDAAGQFIWTHSEIQVAAAVKGRSGPTVVVSEPGGVVGNLEMVVEGVPHYRAGEDVVLFLYRTPIGVLRARGFGQGKYTIAADPAGGSRRVRTQFFGADVVDLSRRAAPVRPAENAPVEEFLTRVRGLVARQGQGVK